jgi:hypothetical protein
MVDVDALAIWLFGGVQVVGLMSAWMTRLSEGSAGELFCQRFFLICLGLVGLATVAAVVVQSRAWIFCGGTLSLMVLATVWDFQDSQRSEPAQVIP